MNAAHIAAAGIQLELLPPPTFCPAWPNKHTLADRALASLLDGRAIDHPEFQGASGSWRLAAVVFNLRAQGWPIETVHDKRGSRVIAQYRLSPDDIAKALAGGAA